MLDAEKLVRRYLDSAAHSEASVLPATSSDEVNPGELVVFAESFAGHCHWSSPLVAFVALVSFSLHY